MAAGRPDVLCLHDGPDDPIGNQEGHASVRQALERTHPTLLVRGHRYWTNPLATLRNGTQVLNVNARVVVLVPSDK